MAVKENHPASLWAATARPAPATGVLSEKLVADVAVIGAGFAGTSAALHVAEAGKSVVLLEAVEIGHGGAGRNNGQVIPSLTKTDPAGLRQRFGEDRGNRFAHLIAGSAAFTFDLIRKHGIEAEAVQNGWLQPAHSPGRAALSRRRYEQWAEVGGDVAYLDRQGVQDLTGATIYHAAWLAHSGGHVNPLGLVRGLAEAAQKAGARIFTQSPVRSVVPTQDGGWRVTTPGGDVTVGKVIVATDAYADNLFPDLRRAIVPLRFFQLATNILPEEVRAKVLPGGQSVSDTHGDLYFFRPTAEGRIVTGGALVFQADWQNRLGKLLKDRFRTVFPAVGDDVRFDYQWDGTIGFTVDFLPHLHELAPGIVTVSGYNGRGVALATNSGKVLAEAALGRAVDDLDIPLSPVKPLPLHGLITQVAGLELARYRWRDAREVRI